MSIAGFGGRKAAGAAPNEAPPSASAEFRALLREAKAQSDAGADDNVIRASAIKFSLPFSLSLPALSLPALSKIKFGRRAHFYAIAAFVWLIGVILLSIMPQNPSLWELALMQLPAAGIVAAAHVGHKKKQA